MEIETVSESESKLKVSIFTPSHCADYLPVLYESIKNQPFYEWVIVTNGKLKKAKLSFDDSRVKIIPYTGDASQETFVGALKAFACENCTGDVLLEVDHDDLLTDNAIEEVIEAFADPEIGFVYSNSANFRRDFEKTERYAEGNGWLYRPFVYKGHELDEVVSFNDHPTAVSRIWFCPNHLRAWRTTVYRAIGGHNNKMRVLDDQELIARTAVATKFKLIDKCLYLYRIIDRDAKGKAKNTWLKNCDEIQANVLPIHSRFIQDIATAWSARNNLLALDLGGRFHNKPGLKSVDLKNADITCDLNEDWPFADNSVGLIVANDIIEHLKDKQHVMSEAHRVLCDGGIFLIMVPSTSGKGAFQDPTHISYWNSNSFWYYTRAEQAKFIDNETLRFQEVLLDEIYPTEWHRQNSISYCRAHLVAVKGGLRLSGQIKI